MFDSDGGNKVGEGKFIQIAEDSKYKRICYIRDYYIIDLNGTEIDCNLEKCRNNPSDCICKGLSPMRYEKKVMISFINSLNILHVNTK